MFLFNKEVKGLNIGSSVGEKAYLGNTEVWVKPIESVYTPGQVLLNKSTGGASGSLIIEEEGVYELRIVGGGGGSYQAQRQANPTSPVILYNRVGGGSAGGFVGQVVIPAGTYAYSVGKAGATGASGTNTTFGNSIAYAGNAFNIVQDNTKLAGAIPNISFTIKNKSIHTAGNIGETTQQSTVTLVAAGSSVYGGYGAGENLDLSGNITKTATAGCIYVAYVGKP